MSLRRKILLFFILGVFIPTVTVYYISLNVFHSGTRDGLISLYNNNILAKGGSVESVFSSALDISIYPLMQGDIIDFFSDVPVLDGRSEPPAALEYAVRERANRALMNNFSYRFSTVILGVTICNNDSRQLSQGLCPDISAFERDKIKRNGITPLWSFPVEGTEKTDAGSGYIQIMRLLRSPRDLRTPVGYSKVTLSKTVLVGNLSDSQTNSRIDSRTGSKARDEVGYYLMDTDSNIMMSTDDTPLDRYLATAPALTYGELSDISGAKVTVVTDGDYFVSAYKIARTPFILFSVVKPAVLSDTGNTLFAGFYFSAIIVALLTIVIALVFSSIITVPLKKLGENMDSLSNENFSVRTKLKGRDEITVLTNHFNTMAERLDYLYREVYMGQITLQAAKLKALQTQISPHFLYNTLDTIYWMSKLGENDKTADMISSLSGMLRYTLTPSDENLTALEKEMEHLKCYVGIQRIRYGDKVDFEIDCPEELNGCGVLKLLLQPLTENALIHGLENGSGTVRIKVYKRAETLVYDVMNNGKKIEPTEINELIERSSGENRGFALNNLAERIRLKNGDGYSLTCFVEGEFSVFRVTQKLIRQDTDAGGVNDGVNGSVNDGVNDGVNEVL